MNHIYSDAESVFGTLPLPRVPWPRRVSLSFPCNNCLSELIKLRALIRIPNSRESILLMENLRKMKDNSSADEDENERLRIEIY